MNKTNKKISKVTEEAFSEDLLDDTISPVSVDTDAIKKQTFAKLGIEYTPSSSDKNLYKKSSAISATPPKKKKKHSALRIVSIAAAIAVIFSTGVYAATVIYKMSQQKVDYFESSLPETPVNQPTYHGNLGVDLEKFNSPVGITVKASDNSVTLDSVSVDDNFINAFFTIVYDEPLDLSFPDDYLNSPAYSSLRRLTPYFTMKVNGEELNDGFFTTDSEDPYMTDDRTVKVMVRTIIPTTLPDVFTLSLEATDSTINWKKQIEYVESEDLPPIYFEIDVDKSASSAYTKFATSGEYTLGDKKIDINKLAISPFGCALTLNGHSRPTEILNGTGNSEFTDEVYDIIDMPNPDYLSVEYLYITDEKGNVLQVVNNMNTVSYGAPFYSNEIMGTSLDTESITFTPILYDENNSTSEKRTYSVTDIGAKIETDSFSGYILEDYVIEGSRISFMVRPYGSPPHTEFVPDDDDLITFENGHSGLVNETTDRKTGITTFSIDYYAATPEELASISTFSVSYIGGRTLDEANSLTLPLKNKQ